ncbi:uncharacterized protein LOC108738071 [Agrilus planipennis]|uniref:Uncharacterized protein LOC108738071 n=1 Tax=Agrilus planipennis TaxID=224129 RepID=A0A1W4WSC4_AGRPL|nr:uncharacterized protein LOC108738071 [Agrilus planipennis]
MFASFCFTKNRTMNLSLSLKLLYVVLFLFFSPCLTYTMYGTKRYNHASTAPRINNPSWNVPAPYYQFLRTERYPSNYEMYPSYSPNQEFAEEYYYPQDSSSSYPVYYPPPRTSRYEVYQAVMPYYYGESPVIRPSNYGYYGYNRNGEPFENLEDEMIQEAEREERERSQPIGQEVLYENDNDAEGNFDDVNAAFLQNLIMSQMYKDSLQAPKTYYEQTPNIDYNSEDSKERWGDLKDIPLVNTDSHQEDEDVKELKQLADPQERFSKQKVNSNISPEERYNWLKSESNTRGSMKDRKFDNFAKQIKRNSVSRKYADSTSDDEFAKPEKNRVFSSGAALSVTPTQSTQHKYVQGQKEEVLARPASSNWQGFIAQSTNSVVTHKNDKKRAPSVYDTIKRMLDMEKQLEKSYKSNELKSPMRKRIVTNEDNLTQQLSVLKKTSCFLGSTSGSTFVQGN